MFRKTLSVCFLLISFIFCDEGTSLRTEKTPEGILVTEGNKPVLFYQRTPKSISGKYERANYVHPLFSLSGDTLTEDFPQDHLHHRGIFWAWHQLWIGEKRIGDGWEIRDISWEVDTVDIQISGRESVILKAHVLWKSPLIKDSAGREEPLVDEVTAIRIWKKKGQMRFIDFEISLLALKENMSIGGSEDEKEYSGFSVRMKLPDDITFLSSGGIVKPINTFLNAGPWLDFSGTFGSQKGKQGLAILCHPSSPGFPQPWILREKRSMQNAVYPGRKPVALKASERLFLRYRIVLHESAGSTENLDEWWRLYETYDDFQLK